MDADIRIKRTELLEKEPTIPAKKKKSKRRRRKRRLMLLAVATLLLALLIATGIFLLPGLVNSYEEKTIQAVIKSDGSEAYIPLPYGKIIKIKGNNNDIYQSYITPDRTRVIVCYRTGLTSITDSNLNQEWSMINCYPIEGSVTDDGFVFHRFVNTEDGLEHVYCRADFSTKTITEITANSITFSESKPTTVSFADHESVFILPSGESERVHVIPHQEKYFGRAVSGDGKVALLSTWDGTGNLILWEDEEEFILSNSNPNCFGSFSSDQKITIVSSGDSLWIKERGKELVSTRIKGEALRPYWTNAGRLESAASSKINKLYIRTRDSDGSYSLYQVSLAGEKDRLLSSARSISFGSTHVAYVDAHDDLYVAAIGKMGLEAEKKIAEDAICAVLCGNEKYLYYFTDVSNEEGTLFGYKIGDSSPVKIATNVLIKDRASTTCVSKNGKTIVFVKDVTDSKSLPVDLGNADDGIECKLMIWNYGDETPDRIANDSVVCAQSMNQYKISAPFSDGESFLVSVFSDSEGLYFYRWNGSSYDLMRYTGKETERIASDVSLGEWY